MQTLSAASLEKFSSATNIEPWQQRKNGTQGQGNIIFRKLHHNPVAIAEQYKSSEAVFATQQVSLT